MHRRGALGPLHRFTLVLVFLALALLVPSALFWALSAVETREIEVGLDLVAEIDERLAPLRERDADERTWQVGVLGDSMAISYRGPKQIPSRLQQAVDELGSGSARIRVHSLASPGLGPFDFYFLADRVAATLPDQVVLPVNLASLSEGWHAAFARPQLAGLLPPSRLPEALGLPLEHIGVTADRLLSYIAVAQAGALEAWREISFRQAKLGAARSQLADRVSTFFGSEAEQRFALDAFIYNRSREVDAKPRPRLTPFGVEQRFAPALRGVEPDFPTLQLLGAAIHAFRERGIEVLVYTSPLNVEHLEAIGSDDPEGLARTLASIETVSEGAGARFLDLHGLLPDAGFRDFAGHLSTTPAHDGPQRVADRIAPLVIETARRARGGHD